ncbi:NnrS family protein [Quisquiliibacterium transsilvanicum]|uniref:Uncharacterized protein involved in response to NO n=1 Tax=Quisquiliibacterium transsilvanicum TaxID=1549638 RepID=A0A7W8HFM7_9BURK|nr:NnrS family protein [Quisquiliibacterium transsilvanicum]MBB5271141.1 uncharacterized protein involved in response to NO [Quisquiliibacterium transsilvanicum]
MSKQLLQIENPALPQAGTGAFALWRLGFRPFYLLGALFAALGIPLWVAVFAGSVALPQGLPARTWHAHEMVFGFALAIITGFLFTAVRNWTSQPTPTGAHLAALCALWLAARIAFVAGAPGLGIVIELAFLLLVAIALLRPLLRSRNRRNYFVGVLFAVLAAADVIFWAAGQGLAGGVNPDAVVRFGLYLVATLTFVIGGRVIPMFTASAVPGLRQFKDARLDRAAIGASVLAFALELAGVSGAGLTVVAAAAALLHAIRLAGWGPRGTLGKPILWILHASYAWAAVGFALMAAAALGWVPRTLSVHAFSVGLVGGLIIGMITRTALGHTGRMLIAGRSEAAMYAMVQLAALLRVFGPLVAPGQTLRIIELSSLLWAAAFLLYLAVYWTRLTRARIDGRDG